MSTPKPPQSDPKPPPEPRLAPWTAVNRLTQMFVSGAISPGDAAALRRLSPDDVAPAAFWRIVTGVLEPSGIFTRRDAERRWAVILAFLAELDGLHAPGVRLGRALAEVDISELRVLRLLRAHDDSLFVAVRHVAHQFGSKGKPFDQAELADVVLSDGTDREDGVRRRIARDFYSHLQRNEAAQ